MFHVKPLVDDLITTYDQLVQVFKFIRPKIVPGKKYQLIFKEYEKNRSLESNKLMWVKNQEIAEYLNKTGLSGEKSVSAETIHAYLTGIFWGQIAEEVFGEIQYRRYETKKFGVKQMNEHLEKINVWCYEQGIVLSNLDG